MQFDNKPQIEHKEDVRQEASKEELGEGPYETHVDTTADSAAYEAIEHSLTLRQALKIYPKAIGWSVAISLAVIMESYDLQIISSFFA
jgi:MFS transporter, SP family, general alpha glucoside:H+ symporter